MARAKTKTKAKRSGRGGKVQAKQAKPPTLESALVELLLGEMLGAAIYAVHGSVSKGRARLPRVLEHAAVGYRAKYSPEFKAQMEAEQKRIERLLGKAKAA